MAKGAQNSRKTRNVKAFLAANELSPVVSGGAHRGGGGFYTLADGKHFTFSLQECQSFKPRWQHD